MVTTKQHNDRLLLEKQICYFSSTMAAESKVADNKAYEKGANPIC